jgi:hypothetical protein
VRRRLLLFGALALVVVWAVVAGIFMIRSASDLQAGRRAANEARAHLGAQEVADRVALPHLKTAARRFASAHKRAHGIVLSPLRILPVIGRQLRSIDALSGSAAEVAAVGADAVDRTAGVIDHHAGAGHARVVQVRQLSEIVDDVSMRLSKISDLGPNVALLGPLATARADLADDLAKATKELRDARAGARAALDLVTGPSTYLVVASNNAEMRAGSGMWLQGGTLHVNDGKLDLDALSPLRLDASPPPGAVKPAGALGSLWSFLEPGNEWRSLMASPSFDDSARTAAAMWKASGHGDVDGVLAVDAVGLQAIVRATGQVAVGDRALTADDVPRYVLHDQYLEFTDAGAGTVDTAARREAIGALAHAAVGAVDQGDYGTSDLLRSLGDAVAGRHLLAWGTKRIQADGWRAAGMDGAFGPSSVLVSLLNIGANKLDWFTHLDATLRRRRTRDGWDVSVEIAIDNRTPAQGEPRYVVGPEPGSGHVPGVYLGILAVNVPTTARQIHFDGVDRLAVAGSDGKSRVVGFPLSIPGSSSRTVTLRFSLPSAVEALDIEPSARVPEVRWHYESSQWEDSAARVTNLSD